MRGTHSRFDRRAERSIYEDLRDRCFVAIVFVTRLSASRLIAISWHVSQAYRRLHFVWTFDKNSEFIIFSSINYDVEIFFDGIEIFDKFDKTFEN